MAGNRNDKLISECSELRADNATLAARVRELNVLLEKSNDVIAAQNVELGELRAECSRKEQWINRYAAQLKQARRSAPSREPSDRRAAMEAAKAEAMRSGRTVAV
jgi:septal ring factor EnvC (AmiA/AmiB activator)